MAEVFQEAMLLECVNFTWLYKDREDEIIQSGIGQLL